MSTILEDILACPDLPSLPLVAVRVIDLTSDPDVSMDDLAGVIQTDQALAAKVLRTINSSFYGLRERCSSIRKAIVMLGLSPVKSLTLGFSLVSSIDVSSEPRFDFKSYWRRGLLTSVAGRTVAVRMGLDCADEVFLAGLLQDVGMFAMYKALGSEYLYAIEQTQGDHSKLVREELLAFEHQHPEIGAMLAQRWRLPDSLVIPIRYHERPTAAPKEALEIVRCAALGGLAHDILTEEDARAATRRFYQRAEQWFRMTTDVCDSILREVSEGAKELADLLDVDAGDFRKAEEVLGAADRQIVAIGSSAPRESFATSKLEHLLTESPDTDAVTGIPSRKGFDAILEKLFETTVKNEDPLTLVQVTIEGLSPVAQQAGQIASDEILLSVIALVNRRFEPLGGIVCRISNAVISILLPGTNAEHAESDAVALRDDVARLSPSWLSGHQVSSDVKVTICAGMASRTAENAAQVTTPAKLLIAATRALQSARNGDGVATYIPVDRAAA
ncbi:MAG: hypothetical protein CMJ31_00720 [Phycisphaerae bacterium]|nr:hypothetical protein [Phycisphaerae bacterium]